MKSIAIRADGSNSIGMGHIMRTLVLAKELAKNNRVFYICKDSNDYNLGKQEIKKYFNIIEVNENNVINDMKDIKADVLITDSYDVNEKYFRNMKEYFEVSGYIDDMNLYDFSYVDFVVNQNYGSENLKYKSSQDLRVLCGSKYTMLRSEFRNKNKIYINSEIKKIGITFGGTDPLSLTPLIMKYLIDTEYEIHVVAKECFEKFTLIKNICRKYKNKFILHINPSMSEFLLNIDVLISAAGSTLYEAAALGVPTIAVVIADNQMNLERNMKKDGLIKSMGLYNRINKEIVIDTINSMAEKECRENMQNKQCIINKLGVFDIIDFMKKYNYID